ncbi:hypothetical protein BCR42DRAFT_455445 [Absidia repens]|uniref:Kinase n=1 Tax=Absidia repens TaxID=90262 RepID=A0A1X2I3S1_9FUNG|nr:hypothetical protein BCR42DRAFT_455445 [Absidia repens]
MPQINDDFTTLAYDQSDPSTLLTRSLPLLPFQNQVGGHCSFFRFSKRAICKPMSHKEQEFYEYLEHHHAPLLPFTSQYLGVVNVTYRSFNAQPMLPEVVLAENQHLLANWKKYLHSSTPSQRSKQRRKQHQQQRRYSSSSNLNKTPGSSCTTDRGDSPAKHCAPPSRSPMTFKEQVLREVFSPDALQERLQQVQDWQRGMRQRQLDDISADQIDNGDNNKNGNSCGDNDGQPRDPMKKSILQTSRSVLDFRRQQLTDSSEAVASARNSEHSSHDPIHSILSNTSSSTTNHNDLVPATLSMMESRVDSADNDQGPVNNDTSSNVKNDDFSGDHMNALQVTVHPRRPSLIDSTTSAPQTPRMRETKLHNPHIRPPSMPSQPPIPNLTSSPSDLSLSPTCLSPTYIESSISTSTATPASASTSYISSSPSSPSAHQQSQQTDQQQQGREAITTTSESASWRPRKEPTNPWSVQMYQRDLEKVSVDDTQQFILIEDLTDEIKYPCVLDLKMGTRQHGVYSNSTKMLSQTKKCERSTSLRLGVRISGMQVYNVNDGQFLFEDKYKGRSLTQHGFRDSLVRYFDNGHGCHIIHLPALIRKLVLIYRIIQTMDSFRFYASSLLIIYDAADNTKDKGDADQEDVLVDKRRKRRIDVRLIDFAKSVTKHEWISYRQEFTYPPSKYEGGGGSYAQTQSVGLLDDNDDGIGPDLGYLLGVHSLISCFVWIYIKHGGKKEDLADLDDLLLFEDPPSWLEEQDNAGNEQDTQ